MSRLRPWLLAALVAGPLLVLGSNADSCIRFKKPGGSVPPGMRDPSDPSPPADEPADADAPPRPATRRLRAAPRVP